MSVATVVSPFRIVLVFALAALGSWLVLPLTKVDLLPKEKLSSVTIFFSLPNASPDIIEQQVTSIIEGACSQLSQLKKISSSSNYNNGSVELQFDKTADIEYKQFEVAAIIRQVYVQLPVGASYPLIVVGKNSSKKQSPLLVYSINAPLQSFRIKQESEDVFHKIFATMDGIKETRISGAENLQLAIRFDKNKCNAWQIDPDQIIRSVQSHFSSSYPGYFITTKGEQYFLQLSSSDATLESIENILLSLINAPPIRLKDIAQIYLEEQEPQGYFRVNGKNSVSLSVYVREGENSLVLGKKIKDLVAQVKAQLPKDFEVRLDYDTTIFLQKEIAKNFQRMGLSISILVLFILLAYRSWRYLVNLFSGLTVSLCLTGILAWLFRIHIHLFTIAGLAISFGIMIDNAIVMLDYYQKWQNRKIFLALLAATLTTIASLCLVFFLPEEEKRNFTDFAIIIMIALVSSLITALWFTPGFYLLLTKSSKRRLVGKPAKKWELKLFDYYYNGISFLARHRKFFLTFVVLGFGLPFFMLPTKWEGNHWYNRWYNATLGSENYQENIKPKVDKWLGGSLYLFVNDVYEKNGYRIPEKTKLYVSAELPYGNTADQMDYIFAEFEKYLSMVKGIDKYVTNIYSGKRGDIEISFKEGFDNSSLPYQLKSKLIAKSLDWDGVEWSVYGVGQGFHNAGDDEIPSFRVIMKGYNYNELEKQANHLAEKLVKHKRIQNVNTNERLDYLEKQSQEYVLDLDAVQMARYNTSQLELLNKLSDVSKPVGFSAQITIDNQYYPIILKEKEAEQFSNYDLLHNAVKLDTSRAIRIDNLGKLEFRNTANSIHKEDRQYIRIVGFDYAGSAQFGSNYLIEILEEMKNEMPVGYSAEHQNWSWNWGKANRRYILILMLILANFFICSILFENLKQPFFIISMIPISFIGLFLVFSLGNFYFDQGGYAAFIMLGGLVANAAIFTVNDFNNMRKKRPAKKYNRLLIKATTNRARTILLTTISTCCGLIPFLIEGQNEVFWFSLAVGTIGGLLFSLLSIFVLLPVLLWKKK